MTRSAKFTLALGAVALIVAGCASKPKPPITQQAPVALPSAPASGAQAPMTSTTVPPVSRTPMPQTSSPPSGPMAGSAAEFQQSIGDRIYFTTDRWDLSSEAKAALERQVGWLNTYRGVQIMVSGNCDERGTREYNLALGARRADSVKSYFVSLGIDPSRVSTVSYGKERPIDPRPSDEGWAINRNAQTQLTGGAPGV